MVPIDRPKNSTQHMSASNFFSCVLMPQSKKYRYGNFFNISRCDNSVKQNLKKFHLTDFINIAEHCTDKSAYSGLQPSAKILIKLGYWAHPFCKFVMLV